MKNYSLEKVKERINNILCDVACHDGHVNDIIDTEIRPLVDELSAAGDKFPGQAEVAELKKGL